MLLITIEYPVILYLLCPHTLHRVNQFLYLFIIYIMTTVSVLCVTFNRQHLIPFIIYQFKKQSYPNHLMELIIYDDSKERIFPNINNDNIKYIHSNEKKPLGEKRNKLNSIAKGDIIVWFDDDDYYFPNRIKDTVSLLNNSEELIVGCKYTLLYDSFKSKNIYKINHKNNYTQNNILAYKKEYLNLHSYNDSDNYNEEKYFTNDFSEQAVMMEGKISAYISPTCPIQYQNLEFL